MYDPYLNEKIKKEISHLNLIYKNFLSIFYNLIKNSINGGNPIKIKNSPTKLLVKGKLIFAKLKIKNTIQISK